jgi:rubrerythrin
MDMQKALEVLKHGMSTEIWGLRFYKEALARTTDITGQQVFSSLVSDEEKHLEILSGEYAALSGKSKTWISEEEAVRLADSVDPTTIFPVADAAGKLIPANAGDLTALAMAMDFEKRGYEFYQREEAMADNPEAKRIWAHLAAAENKHYTFIQKTHEYLTTNGAWYFDDQEKPFFEG